MLIVESTAGPRKLRGVVDNTNKNFGVQSVVHPLSLVYKLNGVDMTEGVDYTLDWEILGNITMTVAPTTGNPDIVSAHYHLLGSVN